MIPIITAALKEENTLIIPGFGAITITDADKGEVMFLSYLKFDDGKLNNLVQQKKGLDAEQAKAAIQSFVGELESDLQSNGFYDLQSLGKLAKNKDGEIEIVASNGENNTIEEETVTLEEEKITVAEPIVEPEPVSQSAVVAPVEPEPTPIEEAPEKKSEEVPVSEKIEAANKEPETKTEDKTEYNAEQQWKDDLDLPPIGHKVVKKKQPILEKTKKDKKPKSPLFYIGLVMATLIVAATLFIGMFYNSFEKMFPFLSQHKTEQSAPKEETPKPELKEVKEEPAQAPVEEEAVKKEEPFSTPEPVESLSPEPITSSSSNNYYLIVGAFSEVSNAERFQTKLKSEGKSAEVLGPVSGLHLVSAAAFESADQAQKAMSEMQGTYSKVWVYKK